MGRERERERERVQVSKQLGAGDNSLFSRASTIVRVALAAASLASSKGEVILDRGEVTDSLRLIVASEEVAFTSALR